MERRRRILAVTTVTPLLVPLIGFASSGGSRNRPANCLAGIDDRGLDRQNSEKLAVIPRFVARLAIVEGTHIGELRGVGRVQFLRQLPKMSVAVFRPTERD